MSLQSHIAIVCIALLACGGLAQHGLAQASKPREQMLKEQLIEIPTGSIVAVKMAGKQKLRGKLGSVTDTGFEVQTVRDGKIETVNVALNDVKSISKKEMGKSTGWKIGIGALAGVGVFFVIVIAVAAASGW